MEPRSILPTSSKQTQQLSDETQQAKDKRLFSFISKKTKRIKKNSKKWDKKRLGTQAVITVFILSIVVGGYRRPAEASLAVNNPVQAQATPTVDQISSANVAAAVAQSTDLPVATNVANLATSLNTKTNLDQTDNTFLSKPQIVDQSTGRKGILFYTTKAGDTVQSIASAFGISEDTIRWANNMTSDTINPNVQLTIPSTTGVLYTVKSGDTPASIAQKYQADQDLIISYNDEELTGLQVGQRIIVPNGVLPVNERPGYVAPASSYSSSSAIISNSYTTVYAGNGYAYGYCTYYAYNRRAQLGHPVGSNWGNASTWSIYAAAAGFRVDHTPEAGAVFQTGGGWGGYGHVGIVESVNSDGSINVSDMNYAGWNVITNRTIPASQVPSYNYIH